MSASDSLEKIDLLLAASADVTELEPVLLDLVNAAHILKEEVVRLDADSRDELVRSQVKYLLAEIELRKARVERVITKIWEQRQAGL